MSTTTSLILQMATLVGAVMTLAAAVWWLLGPRVERLVERACMTALGKVIAEHDDRLERLEAYKEAHQSPTNLVELAALFDLVNRTAPANPSVGPQQRRGRHGRPDETA